MHMMDAKLSAQHRWWSHVANSYGTACAVSDFHQIADQDPPAVSAASLHSMLHVYKSLVHVTCTVVPQGGMNVYRRSG
jgi:hypothetical protein